MRRIPILLLSVALSSSATCVFAAEAVLFFWAAALACGIDTEARTPRTRRWAWTRSTPTMPS